MRESDREFSLVAIINLTDQQNHKNFMFFSRGAVAVAAAVAAAAAAAAADQLRGALEFRNYLLGL
jgi:hypothetical protein